MYHVVRKGFSLFLLNNLLSFKRCSLFYSSYTFFKRYAVATLPFYFAIVFDIVTLSKCSFFLLTLDNGASVASLVEPCERS